MALEKIAPGAFEGRLKKHNPIYYLAEKVWFDNNLDLLWPKLHRDKLCDALLAHALDTHRSTSGLIINMMRDSYKSTFMHGVFAQFISMREKYVNNRDIRILLLHHREEQASTNLQQLKLKSVHSRFMHRVWGKPPYVFAAADDFGTKGRFDWACKTKGIFHEPSVIAAGMGARNTGFHFDWILGDDLVTEEHRKSKLIRDDALFKYQATRFMLDSKLGREVCSGTPYHVHDLWAKLKNAKHADGRLMYRQFIVGAGGKRADKPLAFPNRLNENFLETRRNEEVAQSGNDVLWWLQYQCEARADSLMATDLAWIRKVSEEQIPERVSRVLIVDPAWKGTKNSGTGDDAALAVIGFERKGFVTLTYLLDLVCSNEMTSLDGINAIFTLMKHWGVTDVAVEEHGGHTFRTDLLAQANSRGVFINLVDLKSKQTNKQERITTFLRRVQGGQFYISENCRNVEVFLSQFEDFPQVEKDDALDVVSYSADPNFAELFAPRWNTEAMGDVWTPPQESSYLSRYCLT